MNEYEVLKRNNQWLDEIKKTAENNSVSFSFDGNDFILWKGGDVKERITTLYDASIYNALLFIRGYNACAIHLERSARLDNLVQ